MTPQEALQQLYTIVANCNFSLPEHQKLMECRNVVYNALVALEKLAEALPTPEAEILATEKKELNGGE